MSVRDGRVIDVDCETVRETVPIDLERVSVTSSDNDGENV